MSKNCRFVDRICIHLYNLSLNLDPDLIPTLIPTLTPTTMAPTEEEWAIIANKYRYRINADEATKDKLIEFIKIIIYLYKTQDLIDNNL